MTRRHRGLGAVASVVLGAALLAGCVAEPAGGPAPVDAAASAGYTPGSPGIGDPYFPLDGNGGYDVARYDLDLSYDPDDGELSGTATISATATQSLSAFDLDFDDLEVLEVAVDGADASWTRRTTEISALTGQPLEAGSDDPVTEPGRSELTVTPASGIADGDGFEVQVRYAGVPQMIDDGFGAAGVFDDTGEGMLVAGQPRVAAAWFPVNDHPADKAEFRIRMSVPDGLTMVSNGRLVSSDSEAGRTVWAWETDQPMAPYLATASVGRFELGTSSVDGIDYWNAVASSLYERSIDEADPASPSYGEVAEAQFAAQPEIVAFLAERFGPYPFGEAGGIAGDVPELEFALENQTRPVYPTWAWEDPDDLGLIVHEYAHQWFGDSVTIERWSDLWLNESFATYAEWLWAEHTGGPPPAIRAAELSARPADDPFWAVEVADPGPADLFDDAVYQRGAMTLQALRDEVGDETFFAIARGWASANAGGTVGTADFIAFAEEQAGTDLTPLFTRWIWTPAKP